MIAHKIAIANKRIRETRRTARRPYLGEMIVSLAFGRGENPAGGTVSLAWSIGENRPTEGSFKLSALDSIMISAISLEKLSSDKFHSSRTDSRLSGQLDEFMENAPLPPHVVPVLAGGRE